MRQSLLPLANWRKFHGFTVSSVVQWWSGNKNCRDTPELLQVYNYVLIFLLPSKNKATVFKHWIIWQLLTDLSKVGSCATQAAVWVGTETDMSADWQHNAIQYHSVLVMLFCSALTHSLLGCTTPIALSCHPYNELRLNLPEQTFIFSNYMTYAFSSFRPSL